MTDEGDEPVGDPDAPDSPTGGPTLPSDDADNDDSPPAATDADDPADEPDPHASDTDAPDDDRDRDPEAPQPDQPTGETPTTDSTPTDDDATSTAADQQAALDDPASEPPQAPETVSSEETTSEGAAPNDEPPDDTEPDDTRPGDTAPEPESSAYDPGVPEDVRTYDRFQKIDGGTYERANDFLRERTYITAREWAIARLCADFRTETGVEMTKIGEHLPELVPFMTDTYSPQAVNQARAAFEEKVRKAGATFLYGAMSDFFTAEELDDVMYEATEVAKFLLEVEGVDLTVEEELEAEDEISDVMREVREHSAALRHDEVACPECGHKLRAEDG